MILVPINTHILGKIMKKFYQYLLGSVLALGLLNYSSLIAKTINIYQQMSIPVANFAYNYKIRPTIDGLVGKNKNGWLQVGMQHGAMVSMTIAASRNDSSAVESLWTAVNQAFTHQTTDGSFSMAPIVDGHTTSKNSEPTSDAFFLGDLCEALLVLKESQIAPIFTKRIEQLQLPIEKAASFLAEPTSLKAMLNADRKATNRIVIEAKALLLAGLLTHNQEVSKAGENLLSFALDSQLPNGIFPENGGGDSSYQAVSLLHLSEIAVYVKRAQILPSLKRGFAWEQSHVEDDGKVSSIGNSRTGNGQEIYFNAPKEINYREVVRAFALFGALTGDSLSSQTAQKITNYALAH